MKAVRGTLAIGLALALGACAGTPPASAPAAPPTAANAGTTAAPPAPPAATPAKTARLDPDETICRRQVTTGSRFAQSRCQTRRQWRKSSEAQADLEQQRRRPATDLNRVHAPESGLLRRSSRNRP